MPHLFRTVALISLTFCASMTHSAQPPEQASEKPSLDDRNAVGAFVQDFYDWYAPIAYRQKNSLPWETAIALKSSLFSTKLNVLLNIDKHTGAKLDGTYVSLDVDPFLNTDNPCERYIVGDVIEYDKSFRVGVQAICHGKLRQKNSLQAEVIKKKDHWQFVNFHYPEGNDVFAVLKDLRKRRGNDLE